MQYLLHDLIKLPLDERLQIIEKMISSLNLPDVETAHQDYSAMSLLNADVVKKLSHCNS